MAVLVFLETAWGDSLSSGRICSSALQNWHPRADAQGKFRQCFQVNRCVPGMERWHSQGLTQPGGDLGCQKNAASDCCNQWA